VLAHALLAAALGLTLLTAAGFKLADRTATAIAAGTFGIGGTLARWILLPLAALETALAAGVLLGPPQAALLAAAVLAAFALAQAIAIAAGRSGAPCGCFGERLALGDGVDLALFTSRDCRLCRALLPRAQRLGANIFDEVAHADAWSVANGPGAPFAAAMAERLGILRAIRATGAVALTGAALTLALGGAPAAAATAKLTDNGTDPSAIDATVAWQLPGGGASMLLRAGGTPQTLPGSDSALGPGLIVWRDGETLVVADQVTLRERLRLPAPGAEEPAVSERWLVWRARAGAVDVLRVADLTALGQPPAELRSERSPGRIGRPSIEGDRVVYHVAQNDGSTIEEIFLPTRRRTTLRKGRGGAQLLNPSELGGTLLFVRSSFQRQQVLIGPRRVRDGSRDRSLLTAKPTARRDAARERGRQRHREGYPGGRAPRLPERPAEGTSVVLWSTALAPATAYVTRIRYADKGTSSVILSLPRR